MQTQNVSKIYGNSDETRYLMRSYAFSISTLYDKLIKIDLSFN